MKARVLLFAYCLLALAGLVIWLFALTGQVKTANHSMQEAQAQLNVADDALTKGSDYLKTLTREQRESRLESTPQEAIELSATIQKIQQSVEEARTAAARSQALVDAYQDNSRRLQLRFVPIIALLIAHIVGAFVFFPRRIA